MRTRPLHWWTITGIAVGLLSVAATATAATNSWTVTTVPAGDPGTNAILEGASFLNASDAWAVGAEFGPAGSTPPPGIAYHYNGTSWSRVATAVVPNVTSDGLAAVSASGTTDAWAVGMSHAPSGGYHGGDSLYEHWNGSAWSVVAGPDVKGMVGVADFSPTDAVAVSSGGSVVHWDGTAWTTLAVPHPNPADTVGDHFVSLSADGPNDIWAVGTFQAASGSNLFALHYNGTSWTDTQLPLPAVGGVLLGISAVSAVSPSNVWVDGSANGGSYVEHWNGTAWSEIALPSGLFYPTLGAIAADSATDVWATGSSATDANGTTTSLLFLHWNGTAWSVATSPLGTTYNQLYAVATSQGAAHFWGFGVNTGNQPLVMNHS